MNGKQMFQFALILLVAVFIADYLAIKYYVNTQSGTDIITSIINSLKGTK